MKLQNRHPDSTPDHFNASGSSSDLNRRDFLAALGVSGTIALGSHPAFASLLESTDRGRSKDPAVIYGAFTYPPTKTLQAEGYYSWPGSSFDAEGREKRYTEELRKIESEMGLRIWISDSPLDTKEQTQQFIEKVKQDKPDGLLLIPFKKGHWPHVTWIIQETGIPAVVLATMGVLLVGHVREMYRTPGVYMINSLDNLEAVAYGLKMIRTMKRMHQSRIISIQDTKKDDYLIPHLGTQVRIVPRKCFVDEFAKLENSEEARQLAARYQKESKKIVEPSQADILDAAKTYFVLKRIVEQEEADALMMECLGGLKKPHMHVPPCMGYMDLRDMGIPAGCEADLDATLTMMLIQNLFDMPSFQHNPCVDTEKHLYFGAHCTCASKMRGIDQPSEPYILRSHAEAGWGCVPQVILQKGQKITLAKYLVQEERPRMILYTGEIVESPCPASTGGCRTNMMTTLNELADVCQLQGHHLCMWYGDFGEKMKAFNQMFQIDTVV
ncbi:MAG: hypothetical protein JW829_14425 [Pirellulales bacterium]|nr:hypothetical protein [Pirellulales bacterium]